MGIDSEAANSASPSEPQQPAEPTEDSEEAPEKSIASEKSLETQQYGAEKKTEEPEVIAKTIDTPKNDEVSGAEEKDHSEQVLNSEVGVEAPQIQNADKSSESTTENEAKENKGADKSSKGNMENDAEEDAQVEGVNNMNDSSEAAAPNGGITQEKEEDTTDEQYLKPPSSNVNDSLRVASPTEDSEQHNTTSSEAVPAPVAKSPNESEEDTATIRETTNLVSEAFDDAEGSDTESKIQPDKLAATEEKVDTEILGAAVIEASDRTEECADKAEAETTQDEASTLVRPGNDESAEDTKTEGETVETDTVGPEDAGGSKEQSGVTPAESGGTEVNKEGDSPDTTGPHQPHSTETVEKSQSLESKPKPPPPISGK
jgi:hypothetical protein